MHGWALHSMEGWGYGGITGRLMSTQRNSDGSYASIAAASWPFSNMADGNFIQHYPIWSSCWTSGNRAANTSLIACESEGRAGTPLNTVQVQNLLRAMKDVDEAIGLPPVREGANKTLWEHKEVWNWSTPNAGPTSCPSDRYQPLYEALLKGDEGVMQEQIDKLNLRLSRLNEAMLARERLRRLASVDDVTVVEEALKVLKEKGITV